MSQDPELNPAKDKVWEVNVEVSDYFPMYVVAESKEEADEVAEANWNQEWMESRDPDASIHVGRAMEGPVKDPDWANSHPWGRSTFKGKQLKVNEIIELINNPPSPLGWSPVYDTQTLLMPFVDSPPPLRLEEEAEA